MKDPSPPLPPLYRTFDSPVIPPNIFRVEHVTTGD